MHNSARTSFLNDLLTLILIWSVEIIKRQQSRISKLTTCNCLNVAVLSHSKRIVGLTYQIVTEHNAETRETC